MQVPQGAVFIVFMSVNEGNKSLFPGYIISVFCCFKHSYDDHLLGPALIAQAGSGTQRRLFLLSSSFMTWKGCVVRCSRPAHDHALCGLLVSKTAAKLCW